MRTKMKIDFKKIKKEKMPEKEMVNFQINPETYRKFKAKLKKNKLKKCDFFRFVIDKYLAE